MEDHKKLDEMLNHVFLYMGREIVIKSYSYNEPNWIIETEGKPIISKDLREFLRLCKPTFLLTNKKTKSSSFKSDDDVEEKINNLCQELKLDKSKTIRKCIEMAYLIVPLLKREHEITKEPIESVLKRVLNNGLKIQGWKPNLKTKAINLFRWVFLR